MIRMEKCKYTDPKLEFPCPVYHSKNPNDRSLKNEGYIHYVCDNGVLAKECDVYPLLKILNKG